MHDRPSRALVAEAIGTFALCFVGILAINGGAVAGVEASPALVTIAFAHGLTIAVMIAALGALSGGHFNPAVTLGFVVTGRMPPLRGLAYWGAQIGGALVASLLVAGLFGGEVTGAGTPNLGPDISVPGGIIVEIVATFFLVLVIFGSAVDARAPKSVFPFAIGLTVALDIMAVGPITGAAMNPARVLGPALATQFYGSLRPIDPWANHLVYWVGPLIGGMLAALLMHHFLMERAPSPQVAERGGPAPAEKRGNP